MHYNDDGIRWALVSILGGVITAILFIAAYLWVDIKLGLCLMTKIRINNYHWLT